MSWREVEVLEAARSVTAARQGPLSRANWLLGFAHVLLREAVADSALPSPVRQRAAQALVGLESERADVLRTPTDSLAHANRAPRTCAGIVDALGFSP